MRVLVFGASGRFGSRLCAALIGEGHQAVGFVRDKTKFESSFPEELVKGVEVIQGDAENPKDIERALQESRCDVFVNCAGSPAPVDGSSQSNQGIIGMTILDVCLRMYEQDGTVLRGWWVCGMAFMEEPNGKVLHDRIPNFRPEHRPVMQRLLSIPTTQIKWSILCPSLMFASGPATLVPSSYGTTPSKLVWLSDRLNAPSWLWTIYYALLWIRDLLGSQTPFVAMPIVLWHAMPLGEMAGGVVDRLGEDKWIGQRVGARRKTLWERRT